MISTHDRVCYNTITSKTFNLHIVLEEKRLPNEVAVITITGKVTEMCLTTRTEDLEMQLYLKYSRPET